MDHGGSALVAHFLIVGAIGEQELLIVAQEGRCIGAAFIPYQYAPSARLQNAHKFRAGTSQVKPMRSLSSGDKIDGSGAKRRILGGSRNPHYPSRGWKRFKLMNAGAAHFRVRFDGKNGIPVF